MAAEVRAPGLEFETLFSPYELGRVELKNRIVAVPHGTAMIERGIPTDDDIAYWEARAAGGVGAMIIGATTTHASGVLRDRRRAEPWNSGSLRQMARRAERVHRHGSAIFCQLNHLGREGVGGASEYAPVAPSAVRSPRDAATPHPLSVGEIEELIEAFVSSAENVREAGYDGIELHAAHGYLIAQFLSAASNLRDDVFGGDLTGRMRFLEEIIAGIRARCGTDCVLGVRLSADEEISGGMQLQDTVAIVRALTDVGAIDYVSITLGQRGAYVKDITHPEGVAVAASRGVKQTTSLPVLVAGRIVDPVMAEAIVRQGSADLVGMARQLVVDPQWPTKAAAGMNRSIRPCIGVNQECRTFPGGILCAASARTGRERWFAAQLRAPRRRHARFVVVGGGPAGLEAARLAAELGASVVLYERGEQLGGQLRLAAAVRSRSGVFALVDHLEYEARRHGVEIQRGTEATPEVLESTGADAIILACGAHAAAPAYPRDDSATVVSVWDLLAGARPSGRRAVVVDDGSGFWDAVSAAELLGGAGVSVRLVTPAASIGAAIPFESIGPLRRRLGERSVAFHPFATVIHVSSSAVRLEHTLTGDSFELDADYVVGYAGARSNDELASQLDECRVVIRAIGDCVSPRRLTHANWDADRTVLELMRADARVRTSARAWW